MTAGTNTGASPGIGQGPPPRPPVGVVMDLMESMGAVMYGTEQWARMKRQRARQRKVRFLAWVVWGAAGVVLYGAVVYALLRA